VVLDHDGRDDGQLFDLVALRLARGHELFRREAVSTATALGPMLDHPIDRARRQQLAAVVLMAILGALLASRGVLGARRLPGGSELGYAEELPESFLSALELLNASLKLPDTAIHREQHLNDRLTSGVIDRLRLGTLHAQ
jgi:hypothetical protein